jgi:hypothetical protein
MSGKKFYLLLISFIFLKFEEEMDILGGCCCYGLVGIDDGNISLM